MKKFVKLLLISLVWFSLMDYFIEFFNQPISQPLLILNFLLIVVITVVYINLIIFYL